MKILNLWAVEYNFGLVKDGELVTHKLEIAADVDWLKGDVIEKVKSLPDWKGQNGVMLLKGIGEAYILRKINCL